MPYRSFELLVAILTLFPNNSCGARIPLFPCGVGESQRSIPFSQGEKEVTLAVNGLRCVRSIFLLVRLELRGCRSHSPFMSWRKTALPLRS